MVNEIHFRVEIKDDLQANDVFNAADKAFALAWDLLAKESPDQTDEGINLYVNQRIELRQSRK